MSAHNETYSIVAILVRNMAPGVMTLTQAQAAHQGCILIVGNLEQGPTQATLKQ